MCLARFLLSLEIYTQYLNNQMCLPHTFFMFFLILKQLARLPSKHSKGALRERMVLSKGSLSQNLYLSLILYFMLING